MAKGKKSGVHFRVHVEYETGDKLEVTCGDRWTAHETANRANMLPGVKSAHYDSTGYSLFNTWESAMESVAAFCNTDSDARNKYLRGENPLG